MDIKITFILLVILKNVLILILMPLNKDYAISNMIINFIIMAFQATIEIFIINNLIDIKKYNEKK